jgi:hypothetical protein
LLVLAFITAEKARARGIAARIICAMCGGDGGARHLSNLSTLAHLRTPYRPSGIKVFRPTGPIRPP